jgi:hypothetical protein
MIPAFGHEMFAYRNRRFQARVEVLLPRFANARRLSNALTRRKAAPSQ